MRSGALVRCVVVATARVQQEGTSALQQFLHLSIIYYTVISMFLPHTAIIFLKNICYLFFSISVPHHHIPPIILRHTLPYSLNIHTFISLLYMCTKPHFICITLFLSSPELPFLDSYLFCNSYISARHAICSPCVNS
jgi:hypothetical protein